MTGSASETFLRTSLNLINLASFQATEILDRPVLKMMDIFVCQMSVYKAFFNKTKHS